MSMEYGIFLGGIVVLCLALAGVWYGYMYHKQTQRLRRRAAASPMDLLNTPPPKAPDVPLASPKSDIGTSSLRGRRPVVLLVDDSPTALKAALQVLEERDYRVITAENGRKAWALLQKDPRPDVIISDIDMPMMNGIELLRLVRTDLVLADVPVILMTGKQELYAQVTRHHKQGLNGLISKPFHPEDLSEQVRFVLQE